jgi:hypothetical protein
MITPQGRSLSVKNSPLTPDQNESYSITSSRIGDFSYTKVWRTAQHNLAILLQYITVYGTRQYRGNKTVHWFTESIRRTSQCLQWWDIWYILIVRPYKPTFKGDSDAQGLSNSAYKVNGIQVNLASTSDADNSTLCPRTSFCLGPWEVFKEFSFSAAFGVRLNRT